MGVLFQGKEEKTKSTTQAVHTLSFTLIGNCHILGEKPASGGTVGNLSGAGVEMRAFLEEEAEEFPRANNSLPKLCSLRS